MQCKLLLEAEDVYMLLQKYIYNGSGKKKRRMGTRKEMGTRKVWNQAIVRVGKHDGKPVLGTTVRVTEKHLLRKR